MKSATVFIRKNFAGISLALFFFFFALRLLTILSAVERISYPDELVTGTLALEWLQGLRLPISVYQADFYSGESVFSAWTALPFFKILGPSLFSLKISRLFMSSLLIALSFYALTRFSGKKPAFAFLLLMTFCPPFVAQSLLLPMTAHTESLLFSVLAFIFLLHYLKGGAASLFSLLLFSVCAGWGVWIYKGSLIAVLAALWVWARRRPTAFLSGHFLFFLFFFSIGLTPWILDNVRHDLRQLSFLGEALPAGLSVKDSALWLLKIPRLIFYLFPLSFSSFDCLGIPAAFYSYAYAVFLFLGLAVWAMSPNRFGLKKSALLKELLAIYLLLFILIFPATRFWIMNTTDFFEFRYLTSFIFLLLIFLCAALKRAPKGPVILAALVLLGAAGQTPLLFQEPFGSALRYKGYSYKQTGYRISQNHFLSHQHFRDYRDIASWFPQARQKYVFWGLLTEAEPPESVVKKALWNDFAAVSEDLKPVYAERLGELFSGQEISPDLFRKIQASLAPGHRNFFWRGYAWAHFDDRLLKISSEVTGAIGSEALNRALGCIDSNPLAIPEGTETQKPDAFYFGAGTCALCDGCFHRPAFVSRLDSFFAKEKFSSEAARRSFSRGFGWAAALVYPEDPLRVKDWAFRLPAEVKQEVSRGVEEFRTYYEI